MSKPEILIIATERWYPTVRLAMALANAGCAVSAVCPEPHPFSRTRALQKTYRYNGLSPLRSVQQAIVESHADFLIPGDDLATHHLHETYQQEFRKHSASPIASLIERSLGEAAGFPVVYARAEFMKVAGEAGVRVPKTEVISDLDELHQWITENGLPTVLKADGTSGGDGVRVVQSREETVQAFRKLQAPPVLARAAKRAVIDRDTTLLRPSITRQKHVVNAQAFISGREATSAAFCWQGSVLASVHFEVIKKVSSAGHATVVRLIEHPEMLSAIEKVARPLKLSGMHGFDFMLDSEPGNAYLIEMNPRSTQVGHLQLGGRRDLPAAIYAALSRCVVAAEEAVTGNDTIALFPQEWLRDPESEFINSAYQDIPWSEPELVAECAARIEARGGRFTSHIPDAQRKPATSSPRQESWMKQPRETAITKASAHL